MQIDAGTMVFQGDQACESIEVISPHSVFRNIGTRYAAVIDAQGDRRWQMISALIAEWQPAALVVGIPRHPDGTAHELTARCEKFARQLQGRTGLPVGSADERYSSAVVEGGRDDEAAAVILQQWFDETDNRKGGNA